MRSTRPGLLRRREFLGGLAATATAAAVGCRPALEPPPARAANGSLEGDALRDEIDSVLDYTLQHRRLNLRDHAAWQILHGVLAFGPIFPIEREDGSLVAALEHLKAGGSMTGFNLEPGVELSDGRRGLRAIVEAGSKTGQGHPDQWFKVFARCRVTPATEIVAGGRTYTMGDWIEQVKFECPRNSNREWSWTLIGLSRYLDSAEEWQAVDDQTWSLEKLSRLEAEQDVNTSACGGTHRLIGMTTALNLHKSQGREATGGWAESEAVILRCVDTAQRFQNPDGTLSSQYFIRPSSSPDLAVNLGSTGHTLEFLMNALDDERLREPWVTRAAIALARIFRQTEGVDLECGALYHAAHGLVMYRERMFGPREYDPGVALQPATA